MMSPEAAWTSFSLARDPQALFSRFKDRIGSSEQPLNFGHNDFDEHQQKRHECGKFYEKSFRPSQKMAVDTHILPFPSAAERRQAYSPEFRCVLVGRIESWEFQSTSIVRMWFVGWE